MSSHKYKYIRQLAVWINVKLFILSTITGKTNILAKTFQSYPLIHKVIHNISCILAIIIHNIMKNVDNMVKKWLSNDYCLKYLLHIIALCFNN